MLRIYICCVYIYICCVYINIYVAYIYIYMLRIAGQTAGTIGWNFFVDTHGWPGEGGVIG